MALVSPGVEVTIIDESQYLPTAVTSVPFILLATAQDKANGSGTGIAPATTKANANKLFTVTSQRDLVSLYGNPFFYKTTDGTPIQGYELNEYGLLAAYSLLGTTNKAFILRADIDLAALVGQVTRPTGAPVDGTFWLDTTNSTWGIQEWNQQTGAFTYKVPLVITEASQVVLTSIINNISLYQPIQSVGNIGDYAIVQVNGLTPDAHYISANLAQAYVFYKAGGDPTGPYYNNWVPILEASGVYGSLWPALTSTITGTVPAATMTITAYDANGDAISAAASVTVTGASTLITAINAALEDVGLDTQLTVTSVPTGSGTGSSAPQQLIWNIVGTNADSIEINSNSTSLLQSLGITTTAKAITANTYQFWSPIVVWGTNAQTPRWRTFDSVPRPTGSVFLKSNNVNNGTNLVLSKYTTAAQVFRQQACNLYSSDAAAIAAIDPTGGSAIPVDTTYALANATPVFLDQQVQLFKRSTSGPITYTGSQVPSGIQAGEQMYIQYTEANQSTYTDPAIVSLPIRTANTANSAITTNEIISAVSFAVGTGSPVVAGVSSQGQLTLTHSEGGSVRLIDATLIGINSAVFNQLGNALYNTVPTLTFNDTYIGSGTRATGLMSASLPTTVVDGTSASGANLVLDFGTSAGWTTGDTFTISTNDGTQPGVAPAVAASYTVTANSTGVITAVSATNNGGSGYTTNVGLSITNAPAGATPPSLESAPLRLNSQASITLAGAGYTYNSVTVNASSYTSGVISSGGAMILGALSSAQLAALSVTGATTLGTPITATLTQASTGATATANIVYTNSTTIASVTITNGALSGSFNNINVITVSGTPGGGTVTGSLTSAGLVTGLIPNTTNTPAITTTLSSGLINKLGLSVANNASARLEGVVDPIFYRNLPGVGSGSASGSTAIFSVITNGTAYYDAVVTSSTPTAGFYTISGLTTGVGSPAGDIVIYVPAGTVASDTVFVVSGIPAFIAPTLLSGFTEFTYVANEGAPVTLPANNTNWYYSVVDQVDIMIQDNGIWQGYRNVTMDSRGYNLTQTDPNGPIIATDAPTTQSDGTALVYGDLWIDSNDLENYPAIFRWENVDQQDQWVAISNADQTTENGVLFQDARWAGSSTVDPINDPIPLITTMLTSNYVDPDAPTPTSYPEGILLFNTRRSGYNVKQFRTNYFTALKYPNANPLPTYSYTWVSVSGLQTNGAPYMGRKAQRALVVRSLKASIATNMSIREEDTFFNLMASPNYCELQPEMVVLNNDRNNTAYIVGDTPLRLPDDATAITAWATNAVGSAGTSEEGLVTRDTYMGLYYPSGITTDLSGSNVVVPPSHMMLRTILRNDQVAYPWFAPAGTRRGTIDNANNIGYIDAATGEFIVTKNRVGIRDVLYSNFINPLTFFTNVGLLNYGNKNSKDSQSSLDRTNVARLIAYLRERLTVLARPFVFEPNDAQTRRDISGVVTTLMADVLSKRGIYDYLVVCDTTNNTPARIDRNELWIDVALEPAKAVEFIYIPVRILNTGEIAGLGQNG
jgi:hypothetical protein